MVGLASPLAKPLARGLALTLTDPEGVGVEPETEALVARFSTPPTTQRKGQINTLIKALKTAGVWSKLDALYVMAGADEQAARRNWIADAYNLTAINSPSFTADRGFAGDGSTSYLLTGFNPTAAVAAKFTQNDAHMGFWPVTETLNAASVTSEFGAGFAYIALNSAPLNVIGRSNSTAGVTLAAAGAWLKHLVWTRSAEALWESYADGVDTGGGTTSSGMDNAEFRVCGRSGAFGVNRNAIAHFGGNLTPSEVAEMRAAVATYLGAVGAI